MSLRWVPNAISAMRALSALPLPWLIHQGEHRLAFALMVAAGLSDGLDGWLAKRFRWQSRLGALLDPMADKAVLTAALLGLWLVGALPGALLGLVLGRDLLIVGGSLLRWRRSGPFTPRPSLAGKLTTFVQILLVLALIGNLDGLALTAAWSPGLMLVVAIATGWSGVDYAVRYFGDRRHPPRSTP